jgi:hypothetical protein
MCVQYSACGYRNIPLLKAKNALTEWMPNLKRATFILKCHFYSFAILGTFRFPKFVKSAYITSYKNILRKNQEFRIFC